MMKALMLLALLHGGDEGGGGTVTGMPLAIPEAALGTLTLGEDAPLDIRLLEKGMEVPDVGVWMSMPSSKVILEGMRACEAERDAMRVNQGIPWWVAVVAAGAALGAGFVVARYLTPRG